MNFVIINGSGGVGKDTFVEMCKKNDANIYNISTIDTVKLYAKNMGWDNDKSDKGRKFLSDLKELWDNYNNGATEKTLFKISVLTDTFRNHNVDTTIFVHCREPEKIDYMKERLLHLGKVITLLIVNDNVEPIQTNYSDKFVADYNYDVTILNNGTLDQLEQQANIFYNEHLKSRCEKC